MTQSKAHIRANNKWMSNNRDRIAVMVKKGQREELKAYAASRGMSLNGFIKYCIDKEMNRSTDD